MSSVSSISCPRCTYSNAEIAKFCEMCHHKFHPEVNDQGLPLTSYHGRDQNQNSIIDLTKDDSSDNPLSNSNNVSEWICSHCARMNENKQPICFSCKQRRRSAIDQALAAAARASRSTIAPRLKCPQCTLDNPPAAISCDACGFSFDEREKKPNAEDSTRARSPQLNASYSLSMDELLKLDENSAQETYNRIVAYCRTNKDRFVDDSFPHCPKSLGDFSSFSPQTDDGRRKTMLRSGQIFWADPARIYTEDGRKYRWSLFRDPKPSDIVQGFLGNCWFMCALAVIAEQPDILNRIFLTKNYSPEGIYLIRLCVDGRWTLVQIDDCLPCFLDGPLVFSKGRRNQLWVSLVEKALAKICGSYERLNSGQISEGFRILTGAPCQKISLEENAYDGSSDEVDDHQPRQFKSDLVWAKLLSAVEAGFLMSATCGCHSNSNPMREFEAEAVGLQTTHAYSVLNVKDIEGLRLIYLRNPWGRFVWNGDWGPKSPLWTPDLKKRLVPSGDQSGAFWMPFQDFSHYFNSIEICKIRHHWCEMRLPVIFHSDCSLRDCSFYMIVDNLTEVDFSLHRAFSRSESSSQDILLLVFEENPETGTCGTLVARSSRKLQSAVDMNTFLRPGKYIVLCLSFNQCGSQKARTEGTLALHSSYPLQITRLNPHPGLLADALIQLVLKEGTKGQRHYEVTPYFLKNRICGLVLMMENRGFVEAGVRVDLTGSQNLVSSRHSLNLDDTIPPKHRRIHVIMTQFEKSQSYVISHQMGYNINPSLDGVFNGFVNGIRQIFTQENVRSNYPPELGCLPPLNDSNSLIHCARPII